MNDSHYSFYVISIAESVFIFKRKSSVFVTNRVVYQAVSKSIKIGFFVSSCSMSGLS